MVGTGPFSMAMRVCARRTRPPRSQLRPMQVTEVGRKGWISLKWLGGSLTDSPVSMELA